MKKTIYLFMIMFAMAAVFTSCRDTESNKEKIEETADEIGDGVEEIGDEIEDAIEK